MATEEDDSERDHYEDVATVFSGFLCDTCDAYCSGEPSGARENADTPYGVIAHVGRQEGWLVEPHGDGWRVLCPSCKQDSPSCPSGT